MGIKDLCKVTLKILLLPESLSETLFVFQVLARDQPTLLSQMIAKLHTSAWQSSINQWMSYEPLGFLPCFLAFHTWVLLSNEFLPSFFQVIGQGLSPSSVFSPIVTATCRAGMMTVKVETLDNFLGVVQSRDYRKPECSGYGENSRITYLRINMLADTKEKEYCGVFISDVSILLKITQPLNVLELIDIASEQIDWPFSNHYVAIILCAVLFSKLILQKSIQSSLRGLRFDLGH